MTKYYTNCQLNLNYRNTMLFGLGDTFAWFVIVTVY